MKRRLLPLAGLLILLLAIALVAVPRIAPHFYRETFPLIPGVEYGMSPEEAFQLLGPSTVVEEEDPFTGYRHRYEEREVQVLGQTARVAFDYLRIGPRYVLQAIGITVDAADGDAASAFGMDAVDKITAVIPRKALQMSDRVDAATDQRVTCITWQRGVASTRFTVYFTDSRVVIDGTTNKFFR